MVKYFHYKRFACAGYGNQLWPNAPAAKWRSRYLDFASSVYYTNNRKRNKYAPSSAGRVVFVRGSIGREHEKVCVR